MVTTAAKYTANQANKTATAISQLGRKSIDFNTLPAKYTNKIEIWDARHKQFTQDVTGSTLIWGHPTYGFWQQHLPFEAELLTGIEHYFKFDEDNSIQIDSTGTASGSVAGAIYTPNGKINGAYTYDGGTDKITFSSMYDILNNDVSIVVQVYPNSTGTQRNIIANRYDINGTDNKLALFINTDNTVRVNNKDSSANNFDTTETLNIGSNNLIILTRTGGTYTTYINNIKETFTGKSSGNISAGQDWVTGDTDSGVGFDGNIDEVGIYSKVLTDNEADALYNDNYGVQYPFRYSPGWTGSDYSNWGADFENGSVFQYAYNGHNLFIEGFWNDRFIDFDNSTGTLDTDNETYTLEAEQVFTSSYIAKEDKVYKSVTINVDSEYTSTGSNANDDLVATGIINSIEYPLTINGTTNISNTSNDGLKIKILNNTNPAGIEFPFTFPATFAASDAKEIKLNKILVRYST